MMEDLHKNELDELFRKGLEAAEDKPSEMLWSAIEKGLGTNPPAPAAGSGPASPIRPLFDTMLFKGIAGIAILATVGTSAYFLGRNSHREDVKPVIATISNTETKEPQLPSTEPPTIPQHSEETTPNKDAEEKGGRSSSEIHTSTADIEAVPNESKSLPMPANQEPTRLASAEKNIKKQNQGKYATAEGNDATKIAEKNTAILKQNTYQKKSPLANKKQDFTPLLTASDPIRVVSTFTPLNNNWKRPMADVALIKKSLAGSPIAQLNIPRKNIMPSVQNTSTAGTKAIKSEANTGRLKSSNTNTSLRKNMVLSRMSVMPALAFNTVRKKIEENVAYGPRNGREHREYHETESYGSTVSPGVFLSFDLTSKLSVMTGYTELKSDIQISPKDIKAFRDRDNNIRYRLDCSAGSFYLESKPGTSLNVGDSIRLDKSEVQTRYASIPLNVVYQHSVGRFNLMAMAGTDINILINKTASSTLQTSATEKIETVRSEGLKTTNLNGMVGAGVEFRLGKRLGLIAMPLYRFALKNANDVSAVKTYPKTISLTAGLRINL